MRRRMAMVLGEPAPGPAERLTGLRLSPSPERLKALAYYDLHPLGLERRRAEVIIRLAARASAIERLGAIEPADARERLERLPGIGPWTAAEVSRVAWATRTPSASAITTSPAWSPLPSPANPGQTMPGCSSCSSPTAVSAGASNGSWSCPASGPRGTDHACRPVPSKGCDVEGVWCGLAPHSGGRC